MIIRKIRALLRQRAKKIPAVYRLYRYVKLTMKQRLGLSMTMSDRIEKLFQADSSVSFVQVGSNDGRFGDPIAPIIKQRGNWQGLFIEPVEYVFERLKENYIGCNGLAFAQVAIAEKQEIKPFFYVSESAKSALGEQLPAWYDQLGSFDREHIVKHLDGILEPYIECLEIRCLPLQSVLDEYSVKSIDLLHIDTEGFDYKVLKQFDLKRYHPKAILFEHKHLDNDEKRCALELLKGAGYKLFSDEADTLAVA